VIDKGSKVGNNLMGSVFARQAIVVAALVLGAHQVSSATGEEIAAKAKPSLKAISDAWAARQTAAKTVRFVWREEQTAINLKQQLAALGRGGPSTSGGPSAARSSAVTLRRLSVLCLDGDQFAYTLDTENVQDVNTPGARAKVPSHSKTVLTATAYENYCEVCADSRSPNSVTRVVTLNRPDNCDEPQLPNVRPLLLALRPLTPKLSFIELSDYTISPVRGAIGDTSCVILEPKSDSVGKPKKSYWVDPARDYVIVRAVNSMEGQGAIQTDIFYKRNSVVGWIPSGWSVVDVDGKGRLDQSFHTGVEEFSLNQPIAATEFEVPKPDGALVHDVRNGSDDRRRIGGRTATDVPLVSGRLRFVIVANIVLIVVLAMVVISRKYRRS
jgi:hypothetical protein